MPEHDSMIGPSEEAAALDPTVGDGTPDTAPERDATYGAPLAHPTDHDEDEEEGTMVNPVGGGPLLGLLGAYVGRPGDVVIGS
jgi:hypothetical protein